MSGTSVAPQPSHLPSCEAVALPSVIISTLPRRSDDTSKRERLSTSRTIHECLLQQPILSSGRAFLDRPPQRTAWSTPASSSLARSPGGLRPRPLRYGIHE